MRSAPMLPNRRVRTPTVLQMEAVECGAAALGIVLAHHGRHMPLDRLRGDCGVSRDGSKASALLKAARVHGLDARGLKGDIPALAGIPLPAILFWDFNHFVVLEGFARRGVQFFINDPAVGRRCVEAGEFHGSFTGVILVFSPGTGFRKTPPPPGVSACLRDHWAASPELWSFASLCSALQIAPGIAVTILVSVFVDSYYIGGEDRWLAPILAGLVLAAVVQAALTALQRSALNRWKERQSGESSTDVLARLLRLPPAWFAWRSPGELAGRLSLQSENAALIADRIAPLVFGAIPTIGFAFLLVILDSSLAGWALIFAAAGLAIPAALNRRQMEISRNLSHLEARFEGMSFNALSMIENLKCGGRDGFLRRQDAMRARLLAERQRLEKLRALAAAAPAVTGALALAGILTLGTLSILSGGMTPGRLVAFVVLWAQMMFQLSKWLDLPAHLQRLAANLARLQDLPPDRPVEAASSPGGRFENLIVRSLSFAYSSQSGSILEGVSFTLAPGRRTAIFGPSGAGKTTLARLVTGLLAPSSGEVLLNGRPVSTGLFSGCAAAVEQEIVLLAGSLRENLVLGNATPDPVLLERVLRATGVDTIRNSQEGGLLGPVLEGGGNLSGGQRQRIEIARALSRNPGLLVLDEATSGLDPGAEAEVESFLKSFGCAVLQITHRPESLREADEILVLHQGRIVERGRFGELAIHGRIFRELLEIDS